MYRREFIASLLSSIIFSSCSGKYLRALASSDLTYDGLVPLKGPDIQSRLGKKLLYSKDKKKYGKGRNARKFSNLREIFPIGEIDLNHLNPDNLVMTDENYYTRTEKPNLLNTSQLTHIQIKENFENPTFLPIQTIADNATSQGVTMMECAGNDKYSGFRLMSAANWSGVSFKEFITSKIFGITKLGASFTHVLISGFDKSTESGFNWKGVQSTAGASWVFTINDLIKQKSFFATKMNGKNLSIDRGYPCRLIVPGWYGCASIKWVNKIVFFNANAYTPTTAQMREFSDRTHQIGTPQIISEYKNPVIDYTAIPIKVEKWKKLNGSPIYRIIGLQWGGQNTRPDLRINISHKNKDLEVNKIVDSVERNNLLSWQHWWYWWEPSKTGRHQITLSLKNSKHLSRRLDDKYYRQAVYISDI